MEKEERKLILIDDAAYDRKLYIGSSNAAAIMGLGAKYGGIQQTAYGVWLAKTSERTEEMPPEQRRFLERRKRWEPVVVQMLREELDAEVVAVNQRYRDPEVPYFAAEIDFEWKDTDGSIQNGEIKTVSPFAYGEKHGWGEPGTGDVPIHYEAQTRFGMMVTGRQKCVLAAMVGLDTMLFYVIERNLELEAQMRARCVSFWENNVLAQVPPEAQTIDDLHKMYPVSNGLSVDGTSEVGMAALKLRAARGSIEAIELEVELLEFQVKEHMKDNENLIVDGRKLFTWKDQNFSVLDQSGLKEKEPKIHKQYLLTGKRRVFKSLKGG